ncbi:MAG: ROK family protein [Bacilli bacterium]
MRTAVGIDLGGTFIKGAVVDEAGTIIAKDEVETLAERGPDDILQRIEELVRTLLKRTGIEVADCAGVGIGIPGFIDTETGVAVEVINIGWKDVRVREPLTQSLGLPVYMENDANAAALGEAFAGAGKGSDSAFCITLGTGVGGGVILDGKVLRGASHMAGEIGHIVMFPGGAPCNCGHRGCLETVSSATGVVRLARERIMRGEMTELQSENLTAAEVFAAAVRGDALAQAVVAEAAEVLGRGLAIGANIINPEVIVVGGGMARAGETLFQPLREAFARYALGRVADAVRIVPALLGNDAGVVGASKLALFP